MSEKLALLGGSPAVTREWKHLLKWPVITEEDEAAVLEVLRAGKMSQWDVTEQFEAEYAEYLGVPHCLMTVNGTAALQTAMWAVGVRRGTEIICPSTTYWASGLPALSLGATVTFADIDRDTLCIDPGDIEHRITPNTSAIVVVHYAGYPCDMDAILPFARKHGIPVVEDVSHAHGTLYKGRMTGTMGDVAAMSMMSGKSFVVGEGGMLATSDKRIWERAIAWGHYERHDQLTEPGLAALAGMPQGGVKNRVNQLASALGRTQLRKYPERVAEVQKAMNLFWDGIEGAPGIKPHRPPKDSGSTMGGWYASRGLYRAEELGGLPLTKFAEAVRAEGSLCNPGANLPLHVHPMLHQADIYGDGGPTQAVTGPRDVRQGEGTLPVAESIFEIACQVPNFKHFDAAIIEEHAAAYRKVAENADQLLA